MTADQQRHIALAWHELYTRRHVCATGLRPEIARSWRRCLRLPFGPGDAGYRPPVLSRDAAEQLRHEHAGLLEVVRPVLEDLCSLTRGSGFLTLFTDATGRVLEVLGEEGTLQRAQAINLVVGADWSEEAVGTSAVALVLKEGQAVQVSGPEHFWRGFHALTCSAAPIRDASNQLVAVLDLSGPTHLAHVHTLGMVVASARAIERQLQLSGVAAALRESHEQLDTLLSMIPDGVLLLDRDLRVVRVNSVAAAILGISREEAAGQSAQQLLGRQPLLLQVLQSGRAMQDEELLVHAGGRPVRCIASVKPVEGDGSRRLVLTLRETRTVSRLVHRVRGDQARFTVDDLLGVSQAMTEVRRTVLAAARSRSTVLLLGESGTGKELVAHAIHNASPRREGPFIVLNCAAIPRNLLESELFGYEPGTFTGADRHGRPGKFELADDGTIFLDEIGDMPLEMQASLLRVLQTREVRRLGGTRSIPVDVRVIAATNRDLEAEVRKGNFRADLLYRLDVLTIRIPPLRERPEDIPYLVESLASRWERTIGRRIRFTPDAWSALRTYAWPGNVRELENVIEKCVLLTEQNVVDRQHLPPPLRDAHGPAGPGSPPQPDGLTLQEVERMAFEEAWRATGGRATEVARRLGISRATAYRKARAFGLFPIQT
jgi:PAS domain S-box-containing protein